MSASSKKKLRNEQNAAKMTERQLAEQKEAKKLKLYTTLFTVVLALIVIVAAVFAVTQFITTSGIREKNTVALTIGDQEVSNAELNYYFIDAVNEFYSNYGSYAALFGLDVTAPLNEQVTNEETGTTWADDFLDSAISTIQSTYALCAEAEANGFTLTEDQMAEIDNTISTFDLYAQLYGYKNTEDYLKAYYGNGTTLESFRNYYEMTTLANAYYSEYSASLTYDEATLRAGEEGIEAEYNCYSYNQYYLNANNFLVGGTTDEEGNTTYSDEEKAAAVAAAKDAAIALAEAEIASVADFNDAIAALEVNANAETAPSSTTYTDVAYDSVINVIREWVTDDSRKEGDVNYIANTTTSTDAEGNETTTTNGYYVIYFVGSNDNNYPLANVRHILIGFEGGTYDSNTGTTTYSAEEKLAAQMKAEELLALWESGKATEETFAVMANENSTDPGSNTNGGLYEDVYPGQMVTNFNDWCFDEGRKVGDTGIIETDYGYHIMFYSGDSETMYRDFLIAADLRSAETTEWFNALVEAAEVTEQNTEYLSKDLVLAAG